MTYAYSKLIGRIAELGLSKEEFAIKIGISRTALYHKLQSNSEFTQDEILRIIDVLSIPKEEVPDYFFTLKV